MSKAIKYSLGCMSRPNMNTRTLFALLIPALLVLTGPARAQSTAPDTLAADSSRRAAAHEEAWISFFEHEGVQFSYIHYRRANNTDAGIVMRLKNTNAHPVRYRFQLQFISGDEARTGTAEGTLRAGQMKTGSNDGLFWIPFADGRGIAEIRLPAYDIRPLQR